MGSVKRIVATFEALEVVERLKKEHGPLVFHQSGGCCDGSQPMCFPLGDFRMGTQDVQLGEIEGTGFWMHQEQFEYWKHCQLTLDVVPGRGSSFSLEIPLSVRFHIRSRLFTEEEMAMLEPLAYEDQR